MGRSDVPSDFCFASDKERHFNSLDHGDEHSRHTLSDAPLVSVPKKKLKGNYNQTVLRFAKSNVNEAVFVTCFRICFLCVFPFKGSFVSPVTHATNRIGTRNTHIRPLMYTRRSTRSRSLEIFARAERETRIRKRDSDDTWTSESFPRRIIDFTSLHISRLRTEELPSRS